jgi:hypothetical protein
LNTINERYFASFMAMAKKYFILKLTLVISLDAYNKLFIWGCPKIYPNLEEKYITK